MATALHIDADEGGAVVVRRAQGAAAERLKAEGERLRAATHPGVVQVLASEGDDTAWELRLAHAGRPLDVAAPLPIEVLAGVIAAVATTLADLHDIGIVHGRLRASHILLGAGGHPVLCGFGPGLDAADPADPPTPADDVAALGAILSERLGSETEVEPVPQRRWQRQRAWSGWMRRSLLTLADQACAEPPSRRPSARRLAAAIRDAVPVTGAPRHRGQRRHAGLPNRAVVATAALVVVVAALGVVLGTSASTGKQIERPPTTDPPAAPVEATTPQLSSSPPCAVGAEGSSCSEAVSVDGTTVTFGDRRYEVGEPGDRVLVGDWDCDGSASPAVIRPSTGEVFVFPRWAEEVAVTVGAVTTVPGGTSLVAQDLGGCQVLSVRRDDGELVAITRSGTA